MKADSVSLALRIGVALLVFTSAVGGLYLIGSAQSFYEEALFDLFRLLRILSWLGLLLCWLGLVPWARRHARRVLAAATLGVGFLAIFVTVLVWGAWVYPEAGGFPW